MGSSDEAPVVSPSPVVRQHTYDLALDTYRYLRGGMVVTVVMLAAAVVGERVSTGCWQASISAYFYTAAHSVFIAALCSIGAQLIVYKGTDTEDALLNTAGVLAFGVAFVPTSDAEVQGCPSDGPWGPSDRAVTNNIGAVIVALMLALVVVLILYRRRGSRGPRSLVGAVVQVAFWAIMAAGVFGFLFLRDLFDSYAHMTAAILMFAAIIVNVFVNAVLALVTPASELSPRPKLFAALYFAIGGLMCVTLVVVLVLIRFWTGWQHAVLVIEALLIGEFAAFWVVQTVELWKTPNRIELMPKEQGEQLAQNRIRPDSDNLMDEISAWRQCPPKERFLRAL
ncbi:hypothetical protein BVC93_01405 [Mycobacterium sp. MS1601]|uniref:hypothetical protein n=1 Tax=Mycobacterium sp. MS1601 TaxID=1936029 RepID=UPI0009796F32|nr:hypothetical protein [Mycobacterium sp. MS1601]AQA01306.1 hypothetical protein BVC93_01405 [Mycobacterium sp. MS1601]